MAVSAEFNSKCITSIVRAAADAVDNGQVMILIFVRLRDACEILGDQTKSPRNFLSQATRPVAAPIEITRLHVMHEWQLSIGGADSVIVVTCVVGPCVVRPLDITTLMLALGSLRRLH